MELDMKPSVLELLLTILVSTLINSSVWAERIKKFLPAEVRSRDAISSLYVDGEPIAPMSFCSRNNQSDSYLKGLLDSGIKVHFPICDTEWQDPEGFEKLAVLARRILALDPQAILILRLSLDPPRIWMEENEEECTTFENGSARMIINTKIGRTYQPTLTNNLKFSLASEKWQSRAEQAMADFVMKVGESDFGHRVAGYFLTASETEEWYYTVTYDRRFHAHDFSKPMVTYFKKFLREKYGTNEALAAAWNNDVRSFDQVRVPQLHERSLYTGVGEILLARYPSKSHLGTLSNPGFSAFESDYYRAVNHSVADAIIRFSRRLKELSGGKMLTGAFYGAHNCVVYHEMGVAAAVHKIQDSGVVDICASPASYFNRPPGGQAAHRAVHSSYGLRGMLWFTEEDTRTHLVDPANWSRWSQALDARESNWLLRRDCAKTLTGYNWAWWFENTRTDRWHDDPALLANHKRIQEVFEHARKLGAARTAEIALLTSEDSIYYTDHESLRDLLMWQRQLEFERVGAPFDHYYVRDLKHPDMPDYKLYLFLNAVSLDDADRKAIEEKIAAKGASALWLWAPGLINPDADPKVALENMQAITGFEFNYVTGRHYPRIVIDDPRQPLVAGLPRDRWYGQPDRVMYGSFETRDARQVNDLGDSLVDPVFYLTNPDQVAGGYFYSPGLPNGLGAIGETENAGYRSIYIGAKYVQAELLRTIARRTGVHIYAEEGDTFYVDRNFAVIHARTAGPKTLKFPNPVTPFEVFEKRSYGGTVDEFRFEMEFGETKFFCLQGEF
jgi:hypothetical protein